MKLSTKGRYAIRALTDLALQDTVEPVLMRTIAQRQDIPLQYLEHLISPLVMAGIIRSVRGPKGGIMLARPVEDIKLSEVIRLAEGPFIPAECINNPGVCDRAKLCATKDLLEELKQAMDGVLEGTSLKDLVERQRVKEAPTEAMYYI